MDGQSFLDRFVGVLRLDRGAYEGIKRDGEAATNQARLIVLLTALLSGIGSIASLSRSPDRLLPGATAETARAAADLQAAVRSPGAALVIIVLTVVLSFVVWYIHAAIVGWVGRTLFGADPGATTRVQVRNLIAWGYAPGLLNVLAFVPLLPFAVAIWGLVTEVIAVRTALGLSTGRAVGTVIVAALLPAIVLGCACVALLLVIAGAVNAS